MKKNAVKQPEYNAHEEQRRTDPDGQQKGYNEQNPSQPHGLFRPDGDQTKKTKPTSSVKRASQKEK
jgi:hypothetical protein